MRFPNFLFIGDLNLIRNILLNINYIIISVGNVMNLYFNKVLE